MPDSDPDEITRSHVQLAHGSIIGHYRIIERIGAGGMGEVYLAEDTELNRKVALKFLPLHLCHDPECRARFKREAQAAAKLSHPNIVTIYEVSEFNGRPFFAMENVEGQTIRDFGKGKEQPLSRIIGLAIQVCEGLAKAHSAGIVHRDIKPSNILIDQDGRAKIVDFGLASVHGSEHLTKTGSTLGTVGYMSPEQAWGEEVDARSDLFSFGVVLYELITGRSPFKADSEIATIKNVIEAAPEPLARYKNDMPEELQRIASKALTKDKDLRYQHADEILADLRSIQREAPRISQRGRENKGLPLFIGVSAFLVAIFVAGYFYLQPKQTPSAAKSIAVLPFVDMSPQKDQEYFCDGMTEELINRLSNIGQLRVPARTSAFSFKGKLDNIKEIGEKLGVETVLEGSVRKAGNQLRITTQLINVADGYHIWSESFDRELKEVFAIQDEITTAIIEKLRVTLLPDEGGRLTRSPTNNVEAYNLYLLGQYFFSKGDLSSLVKSIGYYEQAIARDSGLALAWAGESYSYLDLFGNGYKSRGETYPKALAAATRAVELDDNLGIAHAALGSVKLFFEWDVTGAEHEIRLAHALSPDNPDVLHVYCQYLVVIGRFDEAIDGYQRWLELDPVSPRVSLVLGWWGYLYTGQYDKAILEFKRTLSLDARFSGARPSLAFAYASKGLYDSASAMADSDLALIPIAEAEIPRMVIIAWAYAVSGRDHDARRLLERVLNVREHGYVDAYLIAGIYAGLREYDTAWEWLSTAYEERAGQMICLSFDPPFAEMRSEPRVKELLKKMGFPAR